MEDLATSISANAALLSKEMQQNGIHYTTDETCPIFMPLLSPEAALARSDLISAAEKIIRLATGPYDSLIYSSAKVMAIGALRALLNHQVLQRVPLGGSMSFSELSASTSISEQLLTRLVRFVICFGYMTEKSPGRISHNALSSTFIRDGNVANGIMHSLNVHGPMSLKISEAIQLDYTGTTQNLSPFSVAFGGSAPPLQNFWEYTKAHPEFESGFHGLMAASGLSSLWSFQHVVRGYDWSRINSVVDVGGSTGHVSMAIFDSFPHIRFEIQDLPEVIEPAQKRVPDRYTKNISFKAHSFFDTQETTADCYILRFVMHNWPDQDARRIISNLLPALKPGAKIMIFDHIVPNPGEASENIEGMIRYLDTLMYGMLASKERTKDDFVTLLATVDKQLELRYSCNPAGSAGGILVFEYAAQATGNQEEYEIATIQSA